MGAFRGPGATLSTRFAALPRSCALLAQSAEHFHGKEKVVGSIPTEGSAIWLHSRK